MQTSENEKNCAEIAVKPYYVQFSQRFNQLLILSHNLLKTSSSDMHARSQMRVRLVIVTGKVLYLSAGQRYILAQCSRTLCGFWSSHYQSSYHPIKQLLPQSGGIHYLWQYQ